MGTPMRAGADWRGVHGFGNSYLATLGLLSRLTDCESCSPPRIARMLRRDSSEAVEPNPPTNDLSQGT